MPSVSLSRPSVLRARRGTMRPRCAHSDGPTLDQGARAVAVVRTPGSRRDGTPSRPPRAERTRNRGAQTCRMEVRAKETGMVDREQDVLRAASMYYLQDMKMEV